MSKDDTNKPEEKPKEKSAMKQRGFFGDIGRDIKNIGVGLVALPAHFATNPLDMAGKTAMIVMSSAPVIGGVTTAAYAFKQSYRETGGAVRSLAKAVVAGVIAGAVPGTGGAIVAGLAAKNIGEQIEQTVKASENAGVPKTTISAIQDKYTEAKQNIQNLGTPEKRQEIGQDVKKFFSVQGIKDAAKAVRDTIGPLTAKNLEKQNAKMTTEAKESASMYGPIYKSKIEQKIEQVEQKVQQKIDKVEQKIEAVGQQIQETKAVKKIGQLSTHIQNEAGKIRDIMKEKITNRKETQPETSVKKKITKEDQGRIS